MLLLYLWALSLLFLLSVHLDLLSHLSYLYLPRVLLLPCNLSLLHMHRSCLVSVPPSLALTGVSVPAIHSYLCPAAAYTFISTFSLSSLRSNGSSVAVKAGWARQSEVTFLSLTSHRAWWTFYHCMLMVEEILSHVQMCIETYPPPPPPPQSCNSDTSHNQI